MAEKKKQGRIRKFFSDFKAFISRGNILDMAIGVIIGGAFGKIVSSLVNDIIMPLITLAAGGESVEDWKWVITKETADKAESALRYGMFIQSILDFLIIAFFIFLALRIIMNFKNRLIKEEEGALLSKEERKNLIKEYKSQGHSRKEAVLMIEKKEKEMAEAAAAEKAAAEAAAAQAEAAKESSEDILKDIRELLRNNSINSGKGL